MRLGDLTPIEREQAALRLKAWLRELERLERDGGVLIVTPDRAPELMRFAGYAARHLARMS